MSPQRLFRLVWWPLCYGLALAPAGAAERHWVATGECAAADWFGLPSGVPASCWAASAGGPPGASLPLGNDDVHIVRTSGSAELRVPFASAARPAPEAWVRSLRLLGSASVAAGLGLDRGSLDVGGLLAIGQAGQAGLGLLDLSGGALKAQDLHLYAGRLDLSGGSLQAGELALSSQGSAAQLNQTGGSLRAGAVVLSSAQGREAAWSLRGGSADVDAVTLGAAKGPATARWTLGPAASGQVRGALVVGDAGAGRLELEAGAALLAGSVHLGQGVDGVGDAVLGDGARLQAASVTIGGQGRGELLLGTGSRLVTEALVLGDARGSEGRLIGNDRPVEPGIRHITIGRGGRGHMELNTGSTSLTQALFGQRLTLGELPGGDGTLKLQDTSLWLIGSGAVVGSEGRGLLELTRGILYLSAGPLAVGQGAGGRGQVTIRGSNGSASQMTAIDLGRRGAGTLEVWDGARIDRQDMTITLGAEAGGRGELVVGGGAQVLAQRLVASGAGSKRVHLVDGGLLAVSVFELGAASQLVLDGGTVRANTWALGAPGQLDWRSGTLHLRQSTALDGRQLPLRLDLTPGRTLRANGTLALDAGATLRQAGGSFEWATQTVGTLLLQGGSRLEARDTLHARIAGATDSWIQATGALSLGDAAASDGFATGGVLWVGGAEVELRDADAATLGVQTRVTDGGLLRAANGLWLPAGRVLVGEGQARVEGVLRNDGEVVAASGRLGFAGTASGEGSWMGDLRFEAGFDPGDRQVERTFAGGDLEIAAGGWLQLDIVDTRPRLGHDQLSEIGTLTLDGVLRLVFDPGFATDETVRLPLLSFQQFAGRLDAGNVQVLGLPAWRVDWSTLAQDGHIAIAPVPEPGGAALLLAGGALLWARRRRQMSSANSPVCVAGRSKP